MFFSPWPFFPCAGVWHFIIFVMQHITSRNWVQDRHENDFSLGYSYFKVYVYTNELVWLSVIICLFSNLYKRSLQASRLTSRKAFAFFVRVNYEHFLIFSQIHRASTLHARGNQLCETRVFSRELISTRLLDLRKMKDCSWSVNERVCSLTPLQWLVSLKTCGCVSMHNTLIEVTNRT